MSIKKVLAAVGLVCVIAPAAVAAMSQQDRRYAGFEQVKQAMTDLLGLYSLLERDGSAGKPRTLEGNGPSLGDARAAFLPTQVLIPRIAEFADFHLDFSDGKPFGRVELDESVIARAMAVTSGPVGAGGTAAGSSAAPFDGTSSATRGAGGSPGAGAPSAGGGGDGANGGTADNPLLAEASGENGGIAGETVTVMPVPASVWMLLGAVIGLGVVGYRRRRTS